MKAKFRQFLESQYPVALIFLALGILLIAVPVPTLDIISKVVFGIVLILAGALNIISQARSNSNAGLLHLYTGVISVIVGIFLFTNPQVVVKLLPSILGAFILADCIWIVKEILYLKKNRGVQWETYTGVIVIFVILAVLLIINPFGEIRKELCFAGWILTLKGVADIVLSILISKQKKRLLVTKQFDGHTSVVPVDREKKKFHLPTVFGRDRKKEKEEKVSDEIIDVEPTEIDEDVIYSGNQQQTWQEAEPEAGFAQTAQDNGAPTADAEGVEASGEDAVYEDVSYDDAAYDDAGYQDASQEAVYDAEVEPADQGQEAAQDQGNSEYQNGAGEGADESLFE